MIHWLVNTGRKCNQAGSDVSCRVIILYTNALFGHGLRSLLAQHGGFEVPLVLSKDSELASAVRLHRPDVIIVEGEKLSARNARVLLEAAWGEPRLRVVNIRDATTQPTVWRAVTVVPQGQESAADALERFLASSAEAPER
jgi:DNA-binding NarL/FixJ family response regulator